MDVQHISLEILAESIDVKKLRHKAQVTIPSKLRKAAGMLEGESYTCAAVKLKSHKGRYDGIATILIYPVHVSYTPKKI